MQVEIIKTVKQVEIIEVELPYYYKQDLMSDYCSSFIYGKIEEKLCTSIRETKSYDSKEEKYEIEKEKYDSIKNSGLSSYFDEKYKSNQKEFEDVKARCLSFLDEEDEVPDLRVGDEGGWVI